MPAEATSVLDRVGVASPCNARWEDMRGDERVRHCGRCDRNVYDLSALPRADAEDLVRRTEGRLCVQFRRRADGTMLTADCPVGLRAVRRRMAVVAAGLVGAVAFTLFGVTRARASDGSWFADTEPFRTFARLLPPAIRPAAPMPTLRGEMMIAPPRTTIPVTTPPAPPASSAGGN